MRSSERPAWKTLAAAAAALAMFASEALAYDAVKFLEPIRLKEAAEPVALAAGEDRVYVVDKENDAVLIYDDEGRFLKAAGGKGKGPGSLRDPQGIAVGPGGRVFVADTGNERIGIFDREGAFLGSFGSGGSEAGSLSAPEGVAVGTDGRVYVADTGHDRIKVFTSEGIFLYGFGEKGKEPGQFRGPAKAAVDAADGIIVLDGGNERIAFHNPATQFVREASVDGEDLGVDSYGFTYVLDKGRSKVVEFGPRGAKLGEFGSVGKGKQQFKDPRAVAVASGGGLILVLDAGNGRIQRIEVANKLKTDRLASNPAAKLLVSGPAASWKHAVDVVRTLDDEVYAYDPKAGQFIVLDKDGGETRRFGTRKGKGPNVTRGTRGFAVSRTAGLIVSDTPGNRIQLFGLDGEWKATFAEKEGFFDSRKNEGRVRSPRGVAVSEKGDFYVADADNRRVDVFSGDGSFLSAIGPEGEGFELEEPHDLAWDPEGFLYILDRGAKKVLKCGPSGNLVASWGGEGAGVDQFRSPEAIAFDGRNYVYVLDGALRRVSVFTREGRWMTNVFSGGKGERELDDPVSLAVRGSRLVIADKGRDRIQVFDMHPYLVAPVAISTAVKGGTATLSWKPVSDPWAKRYVVLRALKPSGPWERVGEPEAAAFEDAAVAAAQTYFYSIATESRTGDLGAASAPVEVFVPAPANRAPVEISTVVIGNVFSASYKWYLKNPVGSVTVKNNVNVPFEKVKVTFRLKDFMDFGYDTEIKRLGARQEVEVPLIATLNNRILEVSEDTPVQAELELTYFEEGRQQSVSLTKSMRVYARNAIQWDEPRRIGTFITPKDPPVLGLSREIARTAPRAEGDERLNFALTTAGRIWDALSESGVKFISNPNNPYEKISEDPSFPVDNTQFPRDTLKLKSGQCDDLSILLASMLEASSVRTALLDFPGHMALMFDTEASEPEDAGVPPESLVLHDGTWWVPVEATMIGQPFSDAVRKAAYAYGAEKARDAVKVIDVRQAWRVFEPATLPATEWAAEMPSEAGRRKRFEEDAAVWRKARYGLLKKQYEEALKADARDLDALNELGILEHEAGRREDARRRFREALAIDAANAAAWNNLGTLDFLGGDYAAAEESYGKAGGADPSDPEVWLNLTRCAVKLKDAEKARRYAAKAVELEPGLSPVVETWLKDAR